LLLETVGNFVQQLVGETLNRRILLGFVSVVSLYLGDDEPVASFPFALAAFDARRPRKRFERGDAWRKSRSEIPTGVPSKCVTRKSQISLLKFKTNAFDLELFCLVRICES
jgi:hypothetical protein